MPDIAAYTALGYGLGDSPLERALAAKLGLLASAPAHKGSTRYRGTNSTSGKKASKKTQEKSKAQETKERVERGNNHAVTRQLLHEMVDWKHGLVAHSIGAKWAHLVDACPGFTYRHDACGELVFKGNSCHFPLCEHCGARRSRRFLETLVKVKDGYVQNPILGSFTLGANVPVLTIDIVVSMCAAFTALMRRNLLKGRVRGAIRSFEVTWNVWAKNWHPHIHVLFDADFIDKEELAKQWTEECQRFECLSFESLRPWWYDKFDIPAKQRDYFVDLRKADDDAIHEVAKYITKPVDVIRAGAEKVVEFLLAIKGRRLYEKYGSFRAIKIDWESGAVNEDIEEPEIPMRGACPWENCPDPMSAKWTFICKGHFESTIGVEYIFEQRTGNSRIVKGWALKEAPS